VALLDQAGPAALAVARQQITRLVKIRADQVAGVRHPPIDLTRALVAMATGSAAPSEVLAACLPL
jgi:hypothetical protein